MKACNLVVFVMCVSFLFCCNEKKQDNAKRESALMALGVSEISSELLSLKVEGIVPDSKDQFSADQVSWNQPFASLISEYTLTTITPDVKKIRIMPVKKDQRARCTVNGIVIAEKNSYAQISVETSYTNIVYISVKNNTGIKVYNLYIKGPAAFEMPIKSCQVKSIMSGDFAEISTLSESTVYYMVTGSESSDVSSDEVREYAIRNSLFGVTNKASIKLQLRGTTPLTEHKVYFVVEENSNPKKIGRVCITLDSLFLEQNHYGRIDVSTNRKIFVDACAQYIDDTSGVNRIISSKGIYINNSLIVSTRNMISSGLSGGSGAGNNGGGGAGGNCFYRGNDGGRPSDYNPAWNPNRFGIASASLVPLEKDTFQSAVGGSGGNGGGNGYQGRGGYAGGALYLKAPEIIIEGRISTSGNDGTSGGYDDGGGGAGSPSELMIEASIIKIAQGAIFEFHGGGIGKGGTYQSWVGGSGGYAGPGVMKLKFDKLMIQGATYDPTDEDVFNDTCDANFQNMFQPYHQLDPNRGGIMDNLVLFSAM